MHGVTVFALSGWLGDEWEERKISDLIKGRS